MSVMLVPFWKGLVLTLGAALSNSTQERPCASLPVTTRRIGLMSSRHAPAPLERMKIGRAARHPRLLGDRVHVGHHVDHHRPLHARSPACQRAGELAGFRHPDADAAEGFRDLGEIDVREAPHLLGAAALLAAIGGVVEPDLLIERGVVVDDDHRVDVVAARGLELGDVIVETAVAGEADHRPVRQRTFHARAPPGSPSRASRRCGSSSVPDA